MGAKTPEQVKKLNKPRPLVKCDDCGRKFQTLSAFKSHHKFVHAKREPDKRESFKRRDNARPVKKKMVPLHLLKRVNRPEANEKKKTETPLNAVETAAKTPSVIKKPEFECPVCAFKFPVYFTAFRHIQKNHCVDENGEKVAPNSAQLVKPIRIETCASCKNEIRSTIPHECPKMQAYKDQYLCLGCDQTFCGLVLFQHHVKGLHSKDAQNFFFPGRGEFESWKTELQEAMNIAFIRLNKPKTKEIYHCPHQPYVTSTSTTTKLCPATIIVREYSRGIHVCYFKEHCGHIVNENLPFTDFNKYSISLYTRETEDSNLDAEGDNDLYEQFKNMVKCILKDAVKADVSTLKSLLDKAFEMTTILKSYHGEDLSAPVVNKNLSDDQIFETLDRLKPKSKRKQEFRNRNEDVVPKKIKKPAAAVENGVSTRPRRSSTALNKSVSFNKSVTKKIEETTRITTDKELEELLEEGLGLKPQKSSVKKTEEPSKGVLKKVEEPDNNDRQQLATEAKKTEEPPRSLLQSPSSFNDSYKNFVDQNFPTVNEMSTPKAKPNVRKKEVMKTKMGQFKVKPASPKNVSPKSPKTVKEVEKVPITPIVFKPKPDIKYVVKEQENDCNILILKI